MTEITTLTAIITALVESHKAMAEMFKIQAEAIDKLYEMVETLSDTQVKAYKNMLEVMGTLAALPRIHHDETKKDN